MKGKIYLVLVVFALGFVFAFPQMLPNFMQSVIIASDLNMYSMALQTKAGFVQNNSLSPVNEGKSLGGFSTGDAVIDSYIVASSLRYNIDPLLIYVQMSQESNFKHTAISHKGACGLMQLMPDTAKRFGAADIYEPQQNIEAGVKYMRWLLDKFDGDVQLALAGYNAGEGAVMKNGNQIPAYPETRNYVTRITTRYSQIKNLNSVNNTLSSLP